jgi:hypothetical protein
MKFCSELSEKENSCQHYEGQNMYRTSYCSIGERREERRKEKERGRERNWEKHVQQQNIA